MPCLPADALLQERTAVAHGKSLTAERGRDHQVPTIVDWHTFCNLAIGFESLATVTKDVGPRPQRQDVGAVEQDGVNLDASRRNRVGQCTPYRYERVLEMRWMTSWSVILVAAMAACASAETIEFNGHTYELFGLGNGTTLSWTAAYLDATTRTKYGQQGYLARIESPAEMTAVAGLISPFGSAWIGLTDNPTYGGSESSGSGNPAVNGWVWADFNIGTKPFSDTVLANPIMQFAWGSGQPDNDAPFNNAHYVQLQSSGVFVDEDNWANNYVIEYDAVAVPEPGSWLVVSIAAGALATLRGTRRRPGARSGSR